jgi:hypothetical protein
LIQLYLSLNLHFFATQLKASQVKQGHPLSHSVVVPQYNHERIMDSDDVILQKSWLGVVVFHNHQQVPISSIPSVKFVTAQMLQLPTALKDVFSCVKRPFVTYFWSFSWHCWSVASEAHYWGQRVSGFLSLARFKLQPSKNLPMEDWSQCCNEYPRSLTTGAAR